jgi:D-3-phosphoglycerate dehydrogenase
LGASTEEAQTAVSLKIADTIATYLSTGIVDDAINVPRVPPEQVGKARPYRGLARSLGSLVAELAGGPISALEVHLHGRAADLDARTITSEAIAGVLGRSLEVNVNEVNAAALAKRQGIAISESRSQEMQDYVSLIELRAKSAKGITTVAGTLLGEKQPRIVQIDDYDVEAVPEGLMLFTRHDDCPGVVGALGAILGREAINISRMQIGTADGKTESIALIGIAKPLKEAALIELRNLPAIKQAVQIQL